MAFAKDGCQLFIRYPGLDQQCRISALYDRKVGDYKKRGIF